MPRVALNTPAPDFRLKDFRGETVRLSEFKGQVKYPAGIQPRVYLTILPAAYGAVAPGLSGI